MSEAREARDDAIDRVEENADDGWLSLAVRAIRFVAKQKSYFTTDEVWELLEMYSVPGPREPRAMAAAMRRAQDEGIIRRTTEYWESDRKASHARPKRVWASQIAES